MRSLPTAGMTWFLTFLEKRGRAIGISFKKLIFFARPRSHVPLKPLSSRSSEASEGSVAKSTIRVISASCPKFWVLTQNDNYLGVLVVGGGSSRVTSTSLYLLNDITRCHSERSEESLNFFRIVFIFLGKKWYPKK